MTTIMRYPEMISKFSSTKKRSFSFAVKNPETQKYEIKSFKERFVCDNELPFICGNGRIEEYEGYLKELGVTSYLVTDEGSQVYESSCLAKERRKVPVYRVYDSFKYCKERYEIEVELYSLETLEKAIKFESKIVSEIEKLKFNKRLSDEIESFPDGFSGVFYFDSSELKRIDYERFYILSIARRDSGNVFFVIDKQQLAKHLLPNGSIEVVLHKSQKRWVGAVVGKGGTHVKEMVKELGVKFIKVS